MSRPLIPVLLTALTAIVVVLWAVILTGNTSVTRQTVFSAWEDIPMTCDTQRFAQGDGASELFTCRALRGSGPLPAGLYTSPDAQWRSDLTGQEARGNVIRIGRDGVLHGIAVY